MALQVLGLVGTEPHVANVAFDERVSKIFEVSGRLPDLGIHEDTRFEADDVAAFMHEFFPPQAFKIVFEFHPERAEVIGVREAAIDIRTGKYEAPTLAEVNDFFQSDIHEIKYSIILYNKPFFCYNTCVI